VEDAERLLAVMCPINECRAVAVQGSGGGFPLDVGTSTHFMMAPRILSTAAKELPLFTAHHAQMSITLRTSHRCWLTLALAAALPFLFSVNAHADRYVDGSVKVSGTGTLESPFKTIQEAAAVATAGETVFIRAGTYREKVTPANSGTDQARQIIFRPYKDEVVTISGADLVTTKWTQTGGKIYSTELPELFESALSQDEQVFVDGEMLTLARFPNIPPGGDRLQPGEAAYLRIDTVTPKQEVKNGEKDHEWPVGNGGAVTFTFRDSALTQDTGYWNDATLWIVPSQHKAWGFGAIGPVLSHTKNPDGGGEIRAMIYDGTESFFQFHPDETRYYLFNTKECLDAPGEWWLDKAARRLFVWTPRGDSPASHTVEVKRRDYAFDLSDRSYITIKGIHVFAATITTDRDLGSGIGHGAFVSGNRGGYQLPQGAPGAHHITLDGIKARYVSHFEGTTGHLHSQWINSSGVVLSGSHHLLQNSSIAYSAGNGAVVFGDHHVIRNNIIHDVAYNAPLASGIYIAEVASDAHGPRILPMNIEIANNTLFRGGWGLIDGSNLFSTDKSKPSRIHHNYIDGAGLMTRDVGGVRFVGHRDTAPFVNGTRIDHNFVRNVTSYLGNALYLDFNNGYVADRNVVWDSENFFNINDSGDNRIYNNTGLTYTGGIGGNVDPKQWYFRDTIVRNNLTNKAIDKPGTDGRDKSYVADHNIEGTDITGYFIDPAHGDFRLKESATAAIDKGVVIPGYTPAEKPDIGAMEFGEPDWRSSVGADWVITAAPSKLTAKARADGTVTLQWKDNAANEEEYIIERGSKGSAGGNEFVIAGRVRANGALFTDLVTGAFHPNYLYRVRAPRSTYSNVVRIGAGNPGNATIGFTAAEGFKPGSLVGQQNWVNIGGTKGQIAVVEKGAHRAIAITGDENVVARANYTLLDRSFDPQASAVAFSFEMRLQETTAEDKTSAAMVRLGGEERHGIANQLITFALQKRGYLSLTSGTGYSGAGLITDFAPKMADKITIRGVLDFADQKMKSLQVNDKPVAGEWPFSNSGGDKMSSAIWQIQGGVTDPQNSSRLAI
jgi:hypothetical protein